MCSDGSYKKLSLNKDILKGISIKSKVKKGKLILDPNNKDHRYIFDE